jgi:hypothetical protein
MVAAAAEARARCSDMSEEDATMADCDRDGDSLLVGPAAARPMTQEAWSSVLSRALLIAAAACEGMSGRGLRKVGAADGRVRFGGKS